MDREAWRAAIYGVAKSRTWLSDWTDWLILYFHVWQTAHSYVYWYYHLKYGFSSFSWLLGRVFFSYFYAVYGTVFLSKIFLKAFSFFIYFQGVDSNINSQSDIWFYNLLIHCSSLIRIYLNLNIILICISSSSRKNHLVVIYLTVHLF